VALELVNQTITDVRLTGSSGEYGDARLVGVTLKRCMVTQSGDPGFGLVVRNVVLERCQMDACKASGVLFEEITIDALRLAQLHQLSGCVFRHVTLRGRIGSVMVKGPVSVRRDYSDRVACAVRKYKEIDWALDVSEAVFTDDAEFYYVPGDLVRRDPNSQALLRREAFSWADWRDFPGHIGPWVSRFEVTPFDSIVVIAPKGSTKFRKHMSDIEWLHNNGLCE